MQYSIGDLDMLEAFYRHVNFGHGVDFHFKETVILIDRAYVDERIRLMRLNVNGAKNEKYGQSWFEILLAFKQHLTDEPANRQKKF